MNKRLFTLIASVCLLNTTPILAQCVVAGSGFDTKAELCCPVLSSDNEKGGWYNEDLNFDKLCKSSVFASLENVSQLGIGGKFSTQSSGDMTNVDDVFLQKTMIADGSQEQYGYSSITAQPKLIHPFCKANEEANNMFVNIGSGTLCPIVSYTVIGLVPGSTVELSFTLHNLLDPTYFDYLYNYVCKDAKNNKQLGDFITKYNYSNSGAINGNKLDFGVVSSDDNVEINTLYNNALMLMNAQNATSATADYGESTKVTHKAKVPESGNITFYFYRRSDCFQIPIGIDDLKVVGDAVHSISVPNMLCPAMPAHLTTKHNYPEGTKYSWKESKTGLTSSDARFYFTPDSPDEEYEVTCEITMPGCKASKSVTAIHSNTCCTNEAGVPMAMTYLFYDDFGNFVSDDIYEWTDQKGNTHIEQLPVGQVHNAQSHSTELKIPYARAYNFESGNATLIVPIVGTDPQKTELYNHGVYVVSKYGGYPGGVQYDNSGTTTGGMLQFDLLDDGTQDDFIEIDLPHLTTGKEYMFGVDVAAISAHPSHIEIALEYDGKKLASDDKTFSGENGWQTLSEHIVLLSSEVGGKNEISAKLKIRYVDDIIGESRDIAIDNIFFATCTPPDIALDYSVSTGKDLLDLCTEDILVLNTVMAEAAKTFYDEIGYVYQYTFDDPNGDADVKWYNLHENAFLEDESFDVDINKYFDIFSPLAYDKDKSIYFRVVAGEQSDLKNDDSWKSKSAYSPNRRVSISKSIEAKLNCVTCTEPDPVKFYAIGGQFNASKKIVNLCPGESVELGMSNAVHGLDNDNMDYSDYIVKWFKNDIKSSAIVSHKCMTGVDDEAPSITVDYADVEESTTGVKYIISIHDNYDPANVSTPCNITDTITVIASPKPTQTLETPELFCEGTLSSEPEKTIKGYTIDWYETDDTVTYIAEPVIVDLTKAESPKSFYYVVTDNKTGCRGEVEEYRVEVGKADANNVDNTKKIEYKKVDAKNGSLKTLNTQNGSVFKDALSKTGYTLHIGLVNGATEATAPDLKGASLGTASTTIPSPTIIDKDSFDDEYLWYYTYLESLEGCLSDTLLVGVVIKGAPSPITDNAAYCVNSMDVKPMSEYAKAATEDPIGTLIFYNIDKTTKMDATDLPDVTTPGKYTYWVSQESSTGGGESTKQPIVIEVYGVNDVTLAETSQKYCLYEKATDLEDIASVKSSANEYINDTEWEFFSGIEPTLNQAAAGAESVMKVVTHNAGVTKYYARLKYEIPMSTEVCYGKHETYTVEVQSVETPVVTSTIIYYKNDGESGFKSPLTQNSDAIVVDAGCELVWYDKTMTEITEADATPVYDPDLIDNYERRYYITQKNALGCESKPNEISIIVCAYNSSVANTLANTVAITPNPASTMISVVADGNIERVEFINVVGEVVKVSDKNEINISDLSNGLYVVRVTVDEETSIHKLVINK